MLNSWNKLSPWFCESDTPINFNKIEADIGLVGNESADAIAKHAVLDNYGHDEAFPPPSETPDGSTKSGHASSCSQQDFTPMASTKHFSRWTSTLL